MITSLPQLWANTFGHPDVGLVTPVDIGKVAAFLCSKSAALSTGHLIYADGVSSLINSVVVSEIRLV